MASSLGLPVASCTATRPGRRRRAAALSATCAMGYDWSVTSLRFGLKLSQNATIEQLRSLWRLADDAGFDSCWVMDHFASPGPA